MAGSFDKYYVLLSVDDTRCTYCLECVDACVSGALTYDKCFEHDSMKCWNCESCTGFCDALKIRSG